MATQPGSPVAIVTGGVGDIGQAIATALAASGHSVTLADIAPASVGDPLAARLETVRTAAGQQFRYVVADTTSTSACELLVADHPRLDVVVANAGVVHAQAFLDIDADEWRRQLEVNLTGAFVVTQAAARRMVADGTRGLLLFTSSWVAERPWPEIAAYSTSKAGMNQLMRQAALELSAHGIRANAVAPGIVKAGMARHQLETEPAYAARVATAVPLGELQTPEQIGAAVAFLASPAAASMTGTVLLVDAGSTLGTLD
jgi:NAD(P)-dependent dehydrogenase (short-subunit alcohol dehydrogenase family)